MKIYLRIALRRSGQKKKQKQMQTMAYLKQTKLFFKMISGETSKFKTKKFFDGRINKEKITILVAVTKQTMVEN